MLLLEEAEGEGGDALLLTAVGGCVEAEAEAEEEAEALADGCGCEEEEEGEPERAEMTWRKSASSKLTRMERSYTYLFS